MKPVMVAGCMLTALVLGVHAQPSAPIYVQYEGFKHNSDGSYILWFGYFNVNHVDVTVPIGPDNAFVPAPGDRAQPVTFQKGRHRFACTMVVPGKTDEPIQWTVRFAGNTSSTTARVFDPIYELEEQSVKRGSVGLNVNEAPRAVCVNRAPAPASSVTTDAVHRGAAGVSLAYVVSGSG